MFKEEHITLEVPKSGDIRKTLSPLTYYSEMLDKTIFNATKKAASEYIFGD